MTLSEFKAWFDGFTEAMDKTPTQKQWARIKARVAEIDGATVTEKIYVDRYWPSYPRPYWPNPSYYAVGTPLGGWATTSAGYATQATSSTALQSAAQFTPTTAMYALGKAEAMGKA